MDRRDYCKLHIISHYVRALLGSDFRVFPIGKVGDDEPGNRLLREMKEAGFIMDYIEQTADYQTLFSYCFIYPDGSGGNLTTNDSACSKVDSLFVSKAEGTFKEFARMGIALAVPEVSLEAREQLLLLATKYNLFRVASFTSEEMVQVFQSNIIRHVDLLAINLDEAAAAVGLYTERDASEAVVKTVVKKMSQVNPDMLISITHGENGSWVWKGDALCHVPTVKVHHVENTAGAGDACLAGLITGLTIRLSVKEAQ